MLGTVMALCQLGDSGSKALQARAKRYGSLGVLSIAVFSPRRAHRPQVLLELTLWSGAGWATELRVLPICPPEQPCLVHPSWSSWPPFPPGLDVSHVVGHTLCFPNPP